MENDDIVLCQHCGEEVFYEDTINVKNRLICKNCGDPLNKYRFSNSTECEEE